MTFKKASFALQGRWLRALSEEVGGIVLQLQPRTASAAKNLLCVNDQTSQNALFFVRKYFFSPNAPFFLDKRPVL